MYSQFYVPLLEGATPPPPIQSSTFFPHCPTYYHQSISTPLKTLQLLELLVAMYPTTCTDIHVCTHPKTLELVELLGMYPSTCTDIEYMQTNSTNSKVFGSVHT
jgi:hypothetical protein